MKKILSYISIAIISITSVFMFSACADDDGYSFDNYWISIATVTPIAGNGYYLTMDKGTTLLPVASNVYYTPKSNQRALVNFTLLSDSINGYSHGVRVNGIQNILTKEVADIDSDEDSNTLGNDPIKLTSAWVGDGYMNIEFKFRHNNQSHLINLAKDNRADRMDGKIHLELRHNAKEDKPYHVSWGLAAFNIRQFISDMNVGDAKTFVIHVNDWETGSKIYEIEYKKTNSIVSSSGGVSLESLKLNRPKNEKYATEVTF